MSADQRAAWKAALADHHRQQRQQRGRRRVQDASNPRPGMIRIRGKNDGDASTEGDHARGG